MERDISLREVLTSIMDKINSNKSINSEFRLKFTEFNKKFNQDYSLKKVNLTFCGPKSSGKTTLINQIIRHLVSQITNKVYDMHLIQETMNANSSNLLNGEEEEEVEGEKYDGYIELPTREIENTYFVFFVENSETKSYQIILEVNSKQDREALLKLKHFKNEKFDFNNQIIFKFLNNDEGIKKMNKFLDDIDHICLDLIRNQRKVDISEKDEIHEDFNPSKMIIKIPDFPKKYRLIDCPGLSIKTFGKAFIKMINDLDYINYFLTVNDIYLKESYSFAQSIVKEVANEYGSPILYSVITKADKFLKEFPKINKDYNGYVRTNSFYYRNLLELKEKINFRKIIPINDNVNNDDVKKCLNSFFDDLDETTLEYGIANYEASVMVRLRKMICDMNDGKSELPLFSPEQIRLIRISANKAFENYEKKIRDYYEEFKDFASFKNRYPDLLKDLNKIYDNHEGKNDHNTVRSKYINKHIQLSFEDFQKIILRKPQALMITAFDEIYDGFDGEIKRKLLERLSAEGLTENNSDNIPIRIGAILYSSVLIYVSAITMIEFISMRAAGFFVGEALAFALGGVVVPVLGWIVGGVGIVISLSNYIGKWYKKNTRDDITKGLINWLVENKGTIIEDSLSKFKNLREKLIEKLANSKIMVDWIKELLSECDKFKPNSKPFPVTNLRDDLFSIITNQRLKNFFTKVFDHQEAEQEGGESR